MISSDTKIIDIIKTYEDSISITGRKHYPISIFSPWRDESPIKSEEYDHATLTSVFKYKEGGLVNYTGPAWVDGSPERPEAFLNSEDTARIGEAAKILADIPWMDRDTDNASVVTNNGGDVSVEINLNIDHISSDTDIDEMIQRVKDEIVDVARPEGTNVILQQQLN